MSEIDQAMRCEFCGMELSSEDLLRDHREGAHGARCPRCGADFTTGALLANHLRGHDGADDGAFLAQEQGELRP